MSKKSQECYKHLFRFLQREVFEFEGFSFTTDYEYAMRNALGEVFANRKFYSCWFHYCQAIKRKVEKYPMLRTTIRNNEKVNRIYHKILSLPLLPADNIKPAYMMISAEINSLPEAHLFQKFQKYYTRQWLTRVIT